MQRLSPTSVADLCDAIASAAASGARLEICGGGSKAEMGAPRGDAAMLDMRHFAGVDDYDPAELVLTAGAGTPLTEIESLLAEREQMLAFEPFDYATLFGAAPGASTIGGVLAAGVCGPRRLTSGGARDHLLGVEAVSGRGERFIAGGKVVKNVTGYDLPKLLAGSWGRLAAMTSVTLRLLPRPRKTITLACDGLAANAALRAMSDAMASPLAVSAAAHMTDAGRALTLFRLEGFQVSVDARAAALSELLAAHAPAQLLAGDETERLWRDIRQVAPLANAQTLWRIVVAPSSAAALIASLERMGARWLIDWAGALVWTDAKDARDVAITPAHAMLVRAPKPMRAAKPMLQPQAPALARLSARVRHGFDPAGVFETGRFLDAP